MSDLLKILARLGDPATLEQLSVAVKEIREAIDAVLRAIQILQGKK